MDAIARGVRVRPPQRGVSYASGTDMSGGSSDDAYVVIGHKENGRAVLDFIQNQGQSPPFDPNKAVRRFVDALRTYGVTTVTGDNYAGNTFKAQFEALGIRYVVSDRPKHQLYERSR